MKITLLLTFVTLFNAVGSVFPQSGNLTLSLKDATVLEVLNKIENQSNFKFFYQNEQIDVFRKVNVSANKAGLEEVLASLFSDQNIKYKVFEDNLVVLTVDSKQQIAISGTITSSSDGSPIPGVNIVIKGTSIGVVTDLDGKYTISVDKLDVTLTISCVGYKTVDVPLNGQTTIDFKLDEDVTSLDEVVVIGYGVQKKSLVTGAISSIKSDDIQNTSVTRAEQALQGKTSGVQVIPLSGSPGAGMNIRIRGYGSNGNSNPIYIVDGVKTSDIGYIDPNDIASMEVLKDAASCAIYGAEGGNGVIMVTTKQGKSGKTNILYDFQYGFQSPGKLPKLMNIDQYAQYMSETTPSISIDKTYNTDWLNEIFETGTMVKHHLAFTGGNEKSTFLLSLSYLSNDGIVKGSQDKYKRYSVRINTDHKMNSWLKVGNNLSITHSVKNAINENGGEFGGVIGSALQIDPSTPVKFSGNIPGSIQTIIDEHPTVLKANDGNYFGISQYNFGEIVNPFVTMAITNGGVKQDNMNGGVYAEISPIKGLTFTTRFGVDLFYQNNHFWNPVYYYTAERNNGSTLVVDNNLMNFIWSWDNFITYNKSFGDHNITLMAGMSAEDILQRTTNAQGGSMVVENPQFAELSFISSQANDLITGSSPEFKKESYFGRASYDYKNKYLLQGSIRRDGASNSYVPVEGRWGIYPSFSAGWVISNEEIFSKDYISYLKVRGSWGQNGTLSNLMTFKPGGYSYLDGITATHNNGVISYPSSNGNITVFEPGSASNRKLTWETSQQVDIGIDIRALNDRLTFSVDYYNKTTKDLITSANPPLAIGLPSPPINAGNVENKGFEFDLGFKNQLEEFHYSINLNLSTLKNKVTYLDPTIAMLTGSQVGTGWYATSLKESEPIWYFYGYKTDGIDPITGSPNFVKSDGTITNGDGVTANDQTNIGSPIPKLIFGGNINLAYKGIDMSINVSGMSGNKVMMGWIRKDRNRVNRPTYFYDGRWTPDNTEASKPGARAHTLTWNSDQVVFDGSFIRIQQIQLGYTLPSSLLSRIKVSSFRVYVSMENFFTFTKYPGMDPQASPQNGNPNSIGIDRGTYPIPKTLMLGASLSF